MISAHTKSRIEVATDLCKAKEFVLGVRSYVCLSEMDTAKIDNIILYIDSIVNKVMEVRVLGGIK